MVYSVTYDVPGVEVSNVISGLSSAAGEWVARGAGATSPVHSVWFTATSELGTLHFGDAHEVVSSLFWDKVLESFFPDRVGKAGDSKELEGSEEVNEWS